MSITMEEVREDKLVECEDINQFWSEFHRRKFSIKESMGSLTKASSKEGLAAIKVRIGNLQILSTTNVKLLPPYDIKRTQEVIDLLGRDLKTLGVKFQPRTKFTFSARTKARNLEQRTAANAASAAELHLQQGDGSSSSKKDSDQAKTSAPIAIPGSILITGFHSGTRELGKEELTFADGTRAQLLIQDCSDVIISAPHLLGCARLERLNRSKIYLGPCCTSVYLESCTDCTILASSHQLRIHQCNNVNFYVRINGHPIFEDCTNLGFAPYILQYDGISTHFEESKLMSASCWNNVVDFRWHRSYQSPHWRSLSEKEWIPLLQFPTELGWSVDMKVIENEKANLLQEQIKTEPSSSVFTIDLLNSDSGGNDGVSQKADSTPQLSGEGANIVAVEVVESTSDGGGDDDDDEL
jgi:tubulin-specific chaperone C